MAIKKCKECGKDVSTKAKQCPNCGAKSPKETSLLTWFALVAIIGLAANGVFSPNDETGTSSRTPTKSVAATDKKEVKKEKVEPKKPVSSWEYHESKDKMTGKRTGYIVGTSKNIVNGWLKNGPVLLGYTCGKGFYVRANDIGFKMDDLDCGQYSCKRTQYARVKFDEGEANNINFSVWEDNNDGMELQKSIGYPAKDVENFLMQSMKSGSSMYLELELFNTKGAQQIAEFDLTGFTKAVNRCG